MQDNFAFRTFAWLVSSLLAALAFAGAALAQPVVDHSFAFDAISDSPDVEILDYRYGDSRFPAARNPEYLLKEGKALQRINISGPMRRGEVLFVKWRSESTGKTYEDTVDLRKRFPGDISGHKVYFIVKGSQLYVYLISPERRPPDMPPNGPGAYEHRKVVTIYPDSVKP